LEEVMKWKEMERRDSGKIRDLLRLREDTIDALRGFVHLLHTIYKG